VLRYTALMILVRLAGFLFLLLMAGCASSAVMASRAATSEEFVGTTPCDVRSIEFLGGLGTNTPCHSVTWHLTLSTNQQKSMPSTYTLVATYGLPGRNDPNQIEEGPTVRLEGTWEIVGASAANHRATVYRVHGQSGRTLSLMRLGKHLLHFLDSDNRLLIGNGGWSFTLNRKGIGYEN
jgi:hypothetical protein